MHSKSIRIITLKETERTKEMELGSEYDLDLSRLTDTTDTVFEYLKDFPAIYTDSGRSALRLLSDRLSGATVLLPDYICKTVPDALPEDCHIIYYPTDRLLRIDTEKLEQLIQAHSADFLYLMHYFGTLQPGDCICRIADFRKKYHLTVIEDTTHSLFSARITVGDYGIASLRKWFPVPDGGVLYTKDVKLLLQKPENKKPVSRKVEAMLLKHLYLTEQFDCNAKYRELFQQEEEAFDRQTEIYGISDMARFLLSHFSVNQMCRQRRQNAAQLLANLHRLEIPAAIKAQPADVLLTLPIYALNRDLLRKYLIQHNIYCAVHWPPGHPSADQNTEWIGNHILSLPMDQRYGSSEITYLSNCLEVCKKECGFI